MMQGAMKELGRRVAGMVLLFACALLVACATFEESGLPGSASSMARNQMMLVRETPPTFGHYRLTLLEKTYPDLSLFVGKQGKPDFLAETSNNGRNYFILYYLDRRHAYACRTRVGQKSSLEFAGPYPITRKEYKTLVDVRESYQP
jgi:hypothetical protein